MEAFSKRFLIEKVDGSLVELRALSVTKTMEYQETYRALATELQSERYKNLNISQAYTNAARFRHYIDSLFKLFEADIKASEIAPALLYSLLFPHETEDGGYRTVGTLTEFVIGVPRKKDQYKVLKDEVDQYADAMSNLLVAFKSYDQAIAMLDCLTPEDLIRVLNSYADKIKTPDQKKAEKLRGEVDSLKKKWINKNAELKQKVTKVEELSQNEVKKLLNNARKP